MMEITINIKAPELAEALHALAKAVKPTEISMGCDPNAVKAMAAPLQGATPPPALDTTPQSVAAPPPAQVPVSEPDYTHEQLGRAAAAYMDKAPSNQAQLVALLQQYGVQGVTQLNTPQMRTAFANGLRALGATV